MEGRITQSEIHAPFVADANTMLKMRVDGEAMLERFTTLRDKSYRRVRTGDNRRLKMARICATERRAAQPSCYMAAMREIAFDALR